MEALRNMMNRRVWPPMCLELFFAFSLSAAYYYLVQNYAVGVPNNSTNLWVFSSCSVSNFHLDTIYAAWKGRLSALLLSGWVFDSSVTGTSLDVPGYTRLFGLYQSLWLFLLFMAVILGLRQSLFINFAIFAGLIYNFSPATGLYFYPWDVPAMLFFTLGVLFYERRQIALMILMICVGCFFKETILVLALMLFFLDNWKCSKRVLVFVAVVAFYMVGKKLLLAHLHLKAAALAMGNAKTLGSLLLPPQLLDNIHSILTPTLNQFFFVNAGSMVAVLVLGWRRRLWPYMLVIVAFVGGQIQYGVLHEFRIFMDILPLSMIILAEWWFNYNKPAVAVEAAASAVKSPAVIATTSASAWSVRETFPLLPVLAVLLAGLSVAIPAWRYDAVLDAQAHAMENLKASAANGYGPAELALGKVYLDGQGVKADNVEAYKWFKLAQLQSVPDADNELTNCAAMMTKEQIDAAEDEVKQLLPAPK
jgi:hypothetical protein